MIIYGQIKYKKDFPDYNEIVEKMWFKKKDGRVIEFSHDWDNEDFTFSNSLDRWLNGDRWKDVDVELDREWIASSVTKIDDFDELQFITSHVDILTSDKRALFILIVERMRMVGGLISEDDKKTWITVEEFEKRHHDILSLTYDEADDISFKEIKTMVATRERPADWENGEEERNRAEYFLNLEIEKLQKENEKMKSELEELRAYKVAQESRDVIAPEDVEAFKKWKKRQEELKAFGF
ncbi:hypothetical protein OfM1_18010 [Lactovum odontotermitis]